MNHSATDFLSVSDLFLKARPSEEGGHRFIYLEASNESLDAQGEVVLAKALSDSADYYLRYGNIDLDHVTQTGPRRGIADYARYEIGRPVDVKVDGSATFVKGQIFQGDGPAAANANLFWDSITKLRPPQRWYPSVGGAVIDRDASKRLIKSVRWSNIGLSKTPVNQMVPTVSAVPFGALAKAWGSMGLDLDKAMEAGYGTDSATLADGAALRTQSLDPAVSSYWDFRDRLAGDLRKGRVHASSPAALARHATTAFGLNSADAAEWTERFLADLKAGRTSKRTPA